MEDVKQHRLFLNADDYVRVNRSIARVAAVLQEEFAEPTERNIALVILVVSRLRDATFNRFQVSDVAVTNIEIDQLLKPPSGDPA